jgi:hypothetical protein
MRLRFTKRPKEMPWSTYKAHDRQGNIRVWAGRLSSRCQVAGLVISGIAKGVAGMSRTRIGRRYLFIYFIRVVLCLMLLFSSIFFLFSFFLAFADQGPKQPAACGFPKQTS